MKPTHRATLFWGVCIPLRAYLASRGSDPYLRVAASVLAYRWLSGLENGHIGAFGGPAFWADERPLHGALWGAYALTGNSTWLWADVTVGGVNWFSHHLGKLVGPYDVISER